MTGRYQAYPEYQESDIDFVKQLPKGWKETKVRFEFSFGKGLPITKANLQEKGIPVVNYGEIHSRFGFEVDPQKHNLKCVNESYLKSSPNSLLKKGDIIFADTSEDIEGSGNFTQLISEDKVFAGYHTVIARPTPKHHSRFLAYLLNSTEYRSQIQNLVKGVKVFTISQGIIKGTDIWLPSFEEQKEIANFLDCETAKIDLLILKQEKLIELLKEKLQAIICHAVTSGLNKNTLLKCSGIKWLGKVPNNWETGCLGYYASLNTGATPSRAEPSYWDGDISWIKTGEVNYKTILKSEEKITADGLNNSSVRLSPAGTLLMAMYGQGITRGRVAILGIEATYNQACVAINVSNKVINEYLKYYFIAAYKEVRDTGNETSQMNLNAEIVRKFKINIPPIDEQKEIISYLDMQEKKTKRFN